MTYKHETSGSGAPALTLLIDDGEGHEEHVQESVQDRHVQRNEEDDKLAEQQLQGPDQEDHKPLGEGPDVEIRLGDMLVIARLLAHLLGPAAEDGRRVRLGHGEGDEHPDDKGEDELNPVQPAPARGIREVSTDKGTNGRADEGGGREGGHGDTTLLVPPHVGQGAADEGHWCREGNAADGTADDQGADVLGDGAGYDEDDGDQQCRGVDDPPAIDFRQGCEDDGADTEADDEDGDGEQGDLLADAEGLLDADEIGCDDGRGQGDDEARHGDDHGDVPFVELAPVLGVLRVVGREGDEAVVLLLASGRVQHDRALDAARGVFGRELVEVCILGKGSVWKGVDIEVGITVCLLGGLAGKLAGYCPAQGAGAVELGIAAVFVGDDVLEDSAAIVIAVT